MDREQLNESNLQDRTKNRKSINNKKLHSEIHSVGNNVNLLTENFAQACISNNSASNSSSSIEIDYTNYPSLGQLKNIKGHRQKNSFCKSSMISESQFSLQDFIKSKTNVLIKSKKQKPLLNLKYAGNLLDSSLPIRKVGKFREVPKPKKHSKLKREIMLERLENDQSCEEESRAVEIKDLLGENIVTADELVHTFLSRVVELQEKLYKRDPIKGKSKRRFVVGLHETKKYLTLNKAKIVIIATDIQIVKENGAIQSVVEQVINLCKQNNVFYFFALKRRRLGTLTLKSIPTSCVTIMNYEGAEEQFNNIKILLTRLTKTQVTSPEVEKAKILELLKNN